MKKRRKLNKLKVSIVVILVVLTLTITVFGRYIYNSIREAYLAAEKFYFSSDILTVNGARYQYNNWSGLEQYQIKFDLYSYESEWAKLDYDLNYTITCSTPDSDKVNCSINSGTQTTDDAENGIVIETGTIPGSNNDTPPTNTSIVTIYVNPKTTIDKEDAIKVNVTASTTEPYQKTISCEFTLKSETGGKFSYTIEDEINRDYALLKLTCPSDGGAAIVEFDPAKLRIDSNDEVYINRYTEEGSTETTTINGKKYVKKFIFDMSAETTKYVKFYKVDKSKNYTYPSGEAESEIIVTPLETP